MARNNALTKLATVVEVMEPRADALKGKTFCITGHMGKPRKEIEELIQKAGGQTSSDVNWQTTHLVSNEDWSAGTIGNKKKSSKQLKAESMRIKVIDERTLYDMMSAGACEVKEPDF